MRDTSTRVNTSANSTGQAGSPGISNINYLQSKKMPIKDSNINMDKKTRPMDKAKVLISEWIANSKQYDPYVRSMLMHPEIIKAYVQHSLNIPVIQWRSSTARRA